jgi:hypothetical protein
MPHDPADPISVVGEVTRDSMHAVVGIVHNIANGRWQIWIWVEGPQDARLASPTAHRDRVQAQFVASVLLSAWQSGTPIDLHAQVAGSAEILIPDALSMSTQEAIRTAVAQYFAAHG